MSNVENFILDNLTSQEQDTLDFSCPADLLEFIKSVGASLLPYEVKLKMWEQMQRSLEQQRYRMAMMQRKQAEMAESEDEAGREVMESEERARDRQARV